jgi:hypothetical protein
MPDTFPVMFVILGMVCAIVIGIGVCSYIKCKK